MSQTETWQGVTTLRDGLVRTGREMWWASLGAVATVGDEAKSVFETLVERGKSLETRADKTPIQKAVSEVSDQIRDLGKRMEDGFQETSRAVLHRFGVPSHAEVQTLITRVEQLAAKIDTISRKEAADVQET